MEIFKQIKINNNVLWKLDANANKCDKRFVAIDIYVVHWSVKKCKATWLQLDRPAAITANGDQRIITRYCATDGIVVIKLNHLKTHSTVYNHNTCYFDS